MKYSSEIKVGAVTLIGLALLLGVAVFYGAIRIGEAGYALHVDFDRVDGLKVGGQVRFAGVDVGRVTHIGVTEAGKARATLRIWAGNSIPEGSAFGIGSDGLLGEKFVNIVPPEERKDFIKPDTVLSGSPPQGLETFILTADKLFNRLDRLVTSLEDVFGDSTVKTSLKDTTRNIDELTAALSRMTVGNEGNINAIARNLAVMSGSLRDVAARVDKMSTAVDREGNFSKDLTETLSNLRSASARLEKMAAALEPVATDPETSRNIKTTLKNAREVTEKANHILGNVEKIKTEAGMEMMYSGALNRYRTNLDFQINADSRRYARIGVADVGEANRLNLLLGQQGQILGGHFGVVESKAGAGIDLQFGKDFKISADAYDPNDFQIKLRSEIRIAPSTYIVGESLSINKDAQRSSYIGIRRTF